MLDSTSRTIFCNMFVHQYSYKENIFACDLKAHDHGIFVHMKKLHLQFVLRTLFNLSNPENIVSSGNIVVDNFAFTNLVQWVKYSKLVQISYKIVYCLDYISQLITMSLCIHVSNKIPFILNSNGEALQKVDCTLMKLFKCEICGQIQDYFSRNNQSQYTVGIYCHVH